jgi:hypothetical protein
MHTSNPVNLAEDSLEVMLARQEVRRQQARFERALEQVETQLDVTASRVEGALDRARDTAYRVTAPVRYARANPLPVIAVSLLGGILGWWLLSGRRRAPRAVPVRRRVLRTLPEST